MRLHLPRKTRKMLFRYRDKYENSKRMARYHRWFTRLSESEWKNIRRLYIQVLYDNRSAEEKLVER